MKHEKEAQLFGTVDKAYKPKLREMDEAGLQEIVSGENDAAKKSLYIFCSLF